MKIEPIGGDSFIGNQYHSESNSSVKKAEHSSQQEAEKTQKPIKSAVSTDTKTEFVIDDSLRLVQTITKDSLTAEVVRKMPTDEYLRLLHLMNDIVPSSLDQKA